MSLTLDQARAEGRAAQQMALDKAEREGLDVEGFKRFVTGWLRRHGPMTGEDLTDAAVEHGFRPANTKSFGGIYAGMAKRGEIVALERGLPRRRGHGTFGATRYGVPA